MTLSRCGTALVTPFRSDGSVDEETLTKLVEWQIDSGIHFLIACGTTAETPTLNHEEWLRVIGIVTEAAAGRVPVLAGCTHNSTLEAVARAGEAASVPGVSGLLTANPFYNKPGQEGQYRHFRAIAGTQGFAETPISLVPVCPGQAKLSMKSGLAEVNIVHLHGGHGGGPWRPQRGGSTRQEKEDDYRPSRVQEVFRHRFMGTSCLSPGYDLS